MKICTDRVHVLNNQGKCKTIINVKSILFLIIALQIIFLLSCTDTDSKLNIDQAVSSDNNVDSLKITATEIISHMEAELRPLVIIKNKDLQGFSLKERMDYYNVPGVSIAVIQNDQMSWAKGYGYADKDNNAIVDENTLFQAASISKPVTAAGALRLVDKGTLKLDTDINRYLKSWQIPISKFTLNQPITLRQLLSHSAGLNDDPRSGYTQDELIPTLVEILNGTEPSKATAVMLDTIPGAIAKYSNGGFCVIQLIMTDMLEKSFPELMNDLIFDDLDMTNSTFDQTLTTKNLSQLSIGYLSTGEKVSDFPLIYPEMAAAGLWTTPTDLSKLLISIGESINPESESILSYDISNEMITAQLEPYGLGFKVNGVGSDLELSHGGANNGYRCYMAYYPKRKAGAIIMTNSDSGMGLYYEILYAIAHEYGWPDYQSIEKTLFPLKPDDMIDFIGKYRMESGTVFTFSIDENHLIFDAGTNAYHLYPESNTKFFDIHFGFTMDFIHNEEGLVNEIVLDRGGVVSKLLRIE
ncbi:serine hydrolase domain-containing protein [Candidatus Neomarinimicrobiota bacterium]